MKAPLSKSALFLLVQLLTTALVFDVSCEAATAVDGIASVVAKQRHQHVVDKLAAEKNIFHVRNSSQQRTKVDASGLAALEKAPMLLNRRGGATVAVTNDVWISSLLHRLKIGFYFALWYALNVAYNSTLMLFVSLASTYIIMRKLQIVTIFCVLLLILSYNYSFLPLAIS